MDPGNSEYISLWTTLRRGDDETVRDERWMSCESGDYVTIKRREKNTINTCTPGDLYLFVKGSHQCTQ